MYKNIVRKSEDGISIVETAIVALIIAIVLAFALPAIANSIRAYNLRSAANHLAERISAVRALAMAKNKNVTFSFNNSSGLYGYDFTGTAGDGVPDTVDPDDPDELSVSYYTEGLPGGVTTTFPGNTPIKITFNSRGELPIGSTAQSIVLTSYSKTVTVLVNLRGKVSVQ